MPALTVLELNLVCRLLVRPHVNWHSFSSWLPTQYIWNSHLNAALTIALLPHSATIDSLHMKLLFVSHFTVAQQNQILTNFNLFYAPQTQTTIPQQLNASTQLPPAL